MKNKTDDERTLKTSVGSLQPADGFDLESILREFGTPESATPVPEAPAKPSASEKKTPPQPDVLPIKPAPEPESKPEEKPVPEDEPEVMLGDDPGDSTVMIYPSATAEDLRVGNELPLDEQVIDVDVYDSVYGRKQKKIKQLKQQILSDAKASEKRAKKERNLRPSTKVTSPVKLPPEVKAEIDDERANKPQGERFRRNEPKPAEKSAEQQKLKPLLNPEEMRKKQRRRKKSLTVRTTLAFIVACPLIYLVCAGALGLPLPAAVSFAQNPHTHALISLVLLGCEVLLGADVMLRGFVNMLTLRASIETLVLTSTVASVGHCIAAVLRLESMQSAEGLPAFAPVCVLPAIGIVFSLLGSLMHVKLCCRNLESSYRLRHAGTLSVLPKKYDGDVIYASADAANLQGFYRTLTERDPVNTALIWVAPLLASASLLLAVYCSVKKGIPFFWAWSVISAFIPALGLVFSSVLPLSRIAKRMYRSGVLIGGGRAVGKLAARSFVLLRDNDIFPEGAVTMHGHKLIKAELGDDVISYAASVMVAAQTGLAVPFEKEAQSKFVPIRPVTDLTFNDAGGISGYVDGHHVIVGTASCIARTHIKVPPEVKLRTAVFCAVDEELAAIFAILYQVTPRSDYLINLLEDNGYIPIIASRDFNITASFIQTRYGVSSADVVYPEADTRCALSERPLELEAGGVLLTGAGENVAEALLACRRYKTTMRLGIVFSLVSSVAGLLLGTLMAYNGWTDAAAPVNMLIYYGLWITPVLCFSGWINRF